jgi:hypothetical protein
MMVAMMVRCSDHGLTLTDEAMVVKHFRKRPGESKIGAHVNDIFM